ncbi:hypothetical protein F4604DRAFT_1685767 [Suillus subluteus]|nr:hypothetical protein F4604DRAFT_1690873 [Suillus subluteus]KAG1855284.1 hypothetical protein F4604DRAFT_1685767 [Suillus subluteus]
MNMRGLEPNRERSKYSDNERDIPRDWLDDGWMLLDAARHSVLKREKAPVTEADNTVEDKDSVEDSEEDKDALDDENDDLDDAKDGTDTNDSNACCSVIQRLTIFMVKLMAGTPFADAIDHGKIQSLTCSTDDLHTKKKKHTCPLSPFWSADDDDIPSPP